MFEITFGNNKRVGVNLNEHEFTCNKWKFSWIPCQYAIRRIIHQGEDSITYVHPLLNKYYMSFLTCH